MLIAGVVLGQTASLALSNQPKNLKDGGVCIIRDGKILLATAEERITRTKHAGGYENSLRQGLETLGISYGDLDAIVVSSCCEPVVKPSPIFAQKNFPFVKNYYISSHHLSHAFSCYFPSSFEQAIIMVTDGGGNVLDTQYNGQWWTQSREQSSYYIGKDNSIDLVGGDFFEPFSTGLGEAYRAFTYYLGWHSYIYSANTMALAAYGDPTRYNGYKIFEFQSGKLQSKMINNPYQPIDMILEWANAEGLKLPPPREPRESLENHKFKQDYCDLARFVQTEVEKALIEKVRFLVERTGIRNLCIAGGVGLNCVANQKILENTPIENIFIQPASDDSGQALGNALYGYYKIHNNPRSEYRFSPFLGIKHFISMERLVQILNKLDIRQEIEISDDAPKLAAKLISEGKIIGWYHDRGEYGPRALGNRSILSTPNSAEIEYRCRKIKKRDYFRPFAPSILREFVPQYFDPDVNSPYMLLTTNAKPIAQKLMPSVIHVDSTARLQTVSKDDNPRFHQLIEHFYSLTGIPAVLNTSFNVSGQPIVDSPEDACSAYKSLDLDALFIENFIIRKKGVQITDVVDDGYFEFVLTSLSPDELEKKIGLLFPGNNSPRSEMRLFEEYAKLVLAGRKVTTIRYRKNKIDYPVSYLLPLIATSSESRIKLYQVGWIALLRMRVKQFGTLSISDAIKDGFESVPELKLALQNIYGSISPSELVSIYTYNLQNTDANHH